MFRPIFLLLLILSIGVLIAAAQPRDEPVTARSHPTPTHPVAGPAANAPGNPAQPPSPGNRLLDRIEAGGSLLATAAEAAWSRAETEAMGLLLAQGAPYLTDWIGKARQMALAQGTEPIPADIRGQLRKYYPDDVLKTVRWRVGLGADGTLPARLFETYGRAVTLDNVIIFRDDANARDPVIWAHEMAHVQQYQHWGIEGFARRYVENFRAVERDAWEVTGKWAARQGDPPPP
ncbi:MAG: DUF4157 domain-containing protein [Rhodospirillales bacterium]